MVATIAKPLTLEEFLQLAETKPASEYIEILSSEQNANKVNRLITRNLTSNN